MKSVIETPVADGLSSGGVATTLLADVALAGALSLILFFLVHLNRKSASFVLQHRLLPAAFFVVLAGSATVSLATPSLSGSSMAVAIKLFVAAALYIVAVSIWLATRDRFVNAPYGNPMCVDDELASAMAERDAAREELAEVRAGAERHLRERISALTHSKLALEREVAEHRLAEEMATESKRRLDELILRTKTAIVVLDRDATIIDANHALAQMLDREGIEEIIGRPLARLTGMRDDGPLRHFMDEALRLGSHMAEIEITPPTRASMFIEVIGAATVYADRPSAMCLIRDISGRKNAERDARKRRDALVTELEHARRTSAEKTDFLARMNHEMRTPLSGIIGLSEILRHKASLGPVGEEEILTLTANIRESGTHLLSLIDDLLDLTRLESGTMAFAPTHVTVREEIDAATRTLAPLAVEKSIAIETECPPGLAWQLDQRAFRQIVLNLISNALKFSPTGAKIRVEAQAERGQLRLDVADEGPGVSPADRLRILTPFERGETAKRQGIEGVGLGLAIVSELLKVHGGHLAIGGAQGRGAIFTARFPTNRTLTPGLAASTR